MDEGHTSQTTISLGQYLPVTDIQVAQKGKDTCEILPLSKAISTDTSTVTQYNYVVSVSIAFQPVVTSL